MGRFVVVSFSSFFFFLMISGDIWGSGCADLFLCSLSKGGSSSG